MREVKCYIHAERLIQYPLYMFDSDVEKYIKDWKERVFRHAQEQDADHFIYATKLYDMNNVLLEIDLYAQPLSEDAFCLRTDAVCQNEAAKGRSVWIGAWHKGTNY